MADNDVTKLIQRWRNGDENALSQLTPYIYEELKRLAQSHMRKESPSHTLQATALVNEAFLKLADADIDYASRSHFLATAARMMRRTLVDHARSKSSQKRGGGIREETLNDELVACTLNEPEILELDIALDKLAGIDQNMANAVELVFFGGLSCEETADHLNIARTSFFEDMKFAKAWLRKEMS